LFALLGCVNRGDHATIGGGTGGNGGVTGGAGGDLMTDASQDRGNQDSSVDTVIVDNCDVDGGDAGPTSSCPAMFNFESPAGCGLYGAALGQDTNNPKNTDGFKRVYHTGNASCGRGAMAIDVDLDGLNRLGGEVVIPINPTADYTGKTLSLSVKASAAGGSTVRFQVLLVTTRYEPKSIDVPLTTDYAPVSVVLPDMAGASAAGVIRISLQVHGALTPYVGTVYVDEIDIHDTPDAGSSDVAPTDARDGGAGDVRDAPAGS
jgi:hypothetical protein